MLFYQTRVLIVDTYINMVNQYKRIVYVFHIILCIIILYYTISTDDEPLNQATVLNAISQVSNNFELGIHLGLDITIMNEIKLYPVVEQKQKLVDRLFSTKPESCNWAKINEAITYVKVMEWNDRKSATTTVSTSDASSLTSISTTKSK